MSNDANQQSPSLTSPSHAPDGVTESCVEPALLTQQTGNRLAKLNELSLKLLGLSSQTELYQALLDATPHIVDADYVDLMLVCANREEMEVVAATGSSGKLAVGTRWSLPQATQNSLCAQIDPLVEKSSCEGNPIFQELSKLGMKSLLSVPLLVDERLLGWLHTSSTQPDQYGEQDIQLLMQLVVIVAAMLETYQLREMSQQRTTDLEETTELLNSIVESSPAVLLRWRPGPDLPTEYVSDNIAQFGYSAEAFVTGEVTWPEIVHPR